MSLHIFREFGWNKRKLGVLHTLSNKQKRMKRVEPREWAKICEQTESREWTVISEQTELREWTELMARTELRSRTELKEQTQLVRKRTDLSEQTELRERRELRKWTDCRNWGNRPDWGNGRNRGNGRNWEYGRCLNNVPIIKVPSLRRYSPTLESFLVSWEPTGPTKNKKKKIHQVRSTRQIHYSYVIFHHVT